MSHPVYKPPPVFCTKAKVAKGGTYLLGTTVCAILPSLICIFTSTGSSHGKFEPTVLLSILIGFHNLDHGKCSIVRTLQPANVCYDVNPSLPISPFPVVQNLSSKLIVPTECSLVRTV